MHRVAAFTLIELVIVIVLLGILAATALPKFANLTTQANTAAAQGVSGALASAVSVAHAQWVASSYPATITLESTSIVMSTNGWPEATAGASNNTATAAKCLQVWNGLLTSPPQAGTTCVSPCQYLVNGSGTSCTFASQQGNGNTITYDITTGAVAVS